jgi:hypothetical protein
MSTVNDKLVKAVKLVLALHDKPQFSVPGYLVKLDPKAEEQLRKALLEAEAAYMSPCADAWMGKKVRQTKSMCSDLPNIGRMGVVMEGFVDKNGELHLRMRTREDAGDCWWWCPAQFLELC